LIDGIKIYCRIYDFEQWKSSVKIDLFTPTDLATGETNRKTIELNDGTIQHTITHRGKFETYKVAVKETSRNKAGNRIVTYLLVIDGSLHKNHYSGENYSPFGYKDLKRQIDYLEKSFRLSSPFVELVNLEIGVNVSLPFPVFPYLSKNLLVYKCTPFNRYYPDKKGITLGFVCPLSQYSVKVYDKGKQFQLPYNLMRFELRYLKMQPLKGIGINILSDLKDLNKLQRLKTLLIKAWNNVLLGDDTIEQSDPSLTAQDRELLLMGGNPKYWENLNETNKRQFNYHRSKYRNLVDKYGKGYHRIIREEINNECDRLINSTELYNLTFKVKGNKVQTPQPNKMRFCVSCGRDISKQDKRSSFCSPKSVGEVAAHRCRNKESNRRNNLKAKIERLSRKGLLFDIIPYLNNQPFSTSYVVRNLTNLT
jgi:hypothetical protein